MTSQELTFAPLADAAAPPAFQEAHGEEGGVRRHWRYLLDSLRELGAAEFDNRRQTLERILRDGGATYNDYRDGTAARPWALDPIPLLIDSAEWGEIEGGVRERAELLNLVLRDLYGPRTLLRHGVLPPEMVYAHPGFLRACQGVLLPGEQQLLLYAADIVRTPDGRMRVMSDRTQTPSGTGYALVNRSAMARVFPSLFRDSHVHRLSLYFNSLRLTLSRLNPNGEVARVAVLTPGTYNETYFEHVHLANFLGYPLVQGGDLTVRDGYLWMKTLDGLSRIDVLLRRVDDAYCDPVELRSDSRLGVPGLLETVRSGNVVVANPPGSGALENRALARYLPAAARHFLGRDLALPSVPSWWCGDPADRAYVLEHLDMLVVKTIQRGAGEEIHLGSALSAAERERLRAAIRAEPLRYVAQEYLQPSLTPVWDNGGTALPSILRSFAVAGESSYTVMPGGLTRVGQQADSFEISNRTGSISKDTWVLASEPEKQMELSGLREPAAGRQGTGMELPSRVVENLFWFGRYTERTEASLRLLRTAFSSLGPEYPPDSQTRPLLLRAVTQMTGTYPGFMETLEPEGGPLAELLSVVEDPQRVGSVIFSLRALLGAVEQAQDFMSADSQRILNDLRDEMTELPARLRRMQHAAPEEALDTLITSLLALSGLAQESMVRGQGWHFLDMGRRLERGLTTISLLRSLCVPADGEEDGNQLLESVLVSAEALMTYRRRYQRNTNMADALDLLLLEPANPRSLLFQLEQMERHLAALPPALDGARLSRERQLLLEAGTQLKLTDLAELAAVPEGSYLRAALDQLLSRIQHLVSEAANALSDHYFEHGAGPQPMTPGEEPE